MGRGPFCYLVTKRYLTALRCVQPPLSRLWPEKAPRTGSMCLKRMIGGGWAQQLGWHTRPRHSAHLCRHFPRRLRRLSAASSRSRSTLRSRRRRCWLSTTERFLEKIACFSWGQVRGGEAGAQEPSAEGSRPARIRVTTRANNVADFRGARPAIIFTAFSWNHPRGDPDSG